MSQKEWICGKEAADILHITVRTLYNWKKRGYGPEAHDYGTYTRYRASEVKSWKPESQIQAA